MAILTSAVAINEYTVTATFDTSMPSVDPTALNDALNPVNYSINGGYKPLAVLAVLKIDAQNFDLVTDEMTNSSGYELTSRLASGTASFTGIGVPPFITGVTNSQYGVLEVTFSEDMENDNSLNSISSYSLTPAGSGSAAHVTDVVRLSATQVQLSFTGGGSPYTLVASGLMDLAGNYISPNWARVTIEYPGIDELLTGDKILIDTDLGTIFFTVSSLSKKRMEDLVIQRAKNLGHSAQFSLISKALKNSGINRDEQKLKLFKG